MEKVKSKLASISSSILLKIDIIFHLIAASLLLIACGFILYYAFLNLLTPSLASIITLVNEVLLALIILELLWTVIRFLKKKKFTLGPFFSIGIIAAIRRILLIEAQTTHMEHIPVEKLYEIGLSAVVIIILTFAYYLESKTQGEE